MPYQHKELVNEAFNNLGEAEIAGNLLHVYRSKKNIWDEERTVIVFISDGLKAGQIGWVYNLLDKAKKELTSLQSEINEKPLKQRDKEKLEQKITRITRDKKISDLISWSLTHDEGKYQLNYLVDQEKLQALEDKFGVRILMTDRHDWNTEEIIKAYHGQAFIEQAFKNLKNPYHLAIRPQFHWTDQKIKVHYFICVLGYLLATLLWKQAKEKINFTGTLDNFLDYLNNIRLAVMLETAEDEKKGCVKAIYKLEEASEDENLLIQEFAIDRYHIERRKLSGVGVYT